MNFFKKILGINKKNEVKGLSLSSEKTGSVDTENPSEALNSSQNDNQKKDENMADDSGASSQPTDNNTIDAATSKQIKIESLSNKINDKKTTSQTQSKNNSSGDTDSDYAADYYNKKIYDSLDENTEYIKNRMGNSYDLTHRNLTIVNPYQKINIAFFYISGLADNSLLYDALTETITENFRYVEGELKSKQEISDYFEKTNLTIGSVKKTDTFGNAFYSLLNGDGVLLIEGQDICFLLGARGHKERAVEKPSTHTTVKGANDSFNETIMTNISLIRRRVRTPDLWIKNFVLGEKSNTNCSMLYIKGTASEQVIQEIEKRINENRLKNILDTAYLINIIKEKQNSIFPTIYETERPDIAAANLFEGRVVLLVDGTPFAVIVPTFLIQSIQSVEDYYQKSIIATFFRFIRFLAFWLAIYFPALYICLINFHSELLPMHLLFNIIGQRLEVPFPSFLEILLMLIGFDLLREAGTRMPAPLGSALSFLGAIIIGEAAVSAGLFSSIVVIVVTITGICTLALPGFSLNLTITVLRYFMLIAATIGGLWSLSLASICLITHLASLRSFGSPYLSPISPFSLSGMKDAIMRFPISKLFYRNKNVSDNCLN